MRWIRWTFVPLRAMVFFWGVLSIIHCVQSQVFSFASCFVCLVFLLKSSVYGVFAGIYLFCILFLCFSTDVH